MSTSSKPPARPRLRPRTRAAAAAATVVALLLVPFGGLQSAGAAATHVDNPFVGATQYVNQAWKASVEGEAQAAQAAGNATLATRMRAIENTSTAVWMDRRAAISGADGGIGLVGHLDAALAQQQGTTPETILIVVYDLPGRDCNALASNGELPATADGLNIYKTQYIDPIASAFAQTKYENLRIVAIIEPDSLPNITTNSGVQACQQATPFYEQGVAYALDKLHAIPNVYTYVDAAHAGWLGWPNNAGGAVGEFQKVANMTAAKQASIDGFVTDTANTTPLKEPFFQGSTNVGGTPVMNSSFYEFNPSVDEAAFTADMYQRLTTTGGFSPSIGMLIDTSRNGWGGPQRPTQASTSTSVETFVSESKVDKRPHRGAWCNQNGAGIGERPVATPGGFPSSHLDAFVWVKPPGESDGASTDIPNDEGKRFDRMCDPTFNAPALGGRLTNALPNAPLSGQWFPAQFQQLVQNAFPAIGGGGGDTTPPSVPTNLASPSHTSTSVALSWTASTDNVGVTGYDILRAPGASGGTFAQVGTSTTTTFTDTGLAASSTFRYQVRARDAAGNVSAVSTTVQVTTDAGTGGGGTLKAQHRNYDASATDNQIKPGLQLVNTGSSSASLTGITIRYWFTRDAGASTFSTWCDYAVMGCGNITRSVVLLATPRTNADAYVQVGFTAGTLAGGASTGEMQLRFNKTDWSAFDEPNDHSYTAPTGSYADSTRITVYQNGALIWGTEPA